MIDIIKSRILKKLKFRLKSFQGIKKIIKQIDLILNLFFNTIFQLKLAFGKYNSKINVISIYKNLFKFS